MADKALMLYPAVMIIFFNLFAMIAHAQNVYYKPATSDVKVYENTNCVFADEKFNNSKTTTCDSVMRERLSNNAVIWDCGKTDKNGQCSYSKFEQKNSHSGLPMSFVEYYYFNEVVTDLGDGKPVNVCEQEDPTHGETYKDVVQKIIQTGIEQKQSRAKILEQIDRYLSKKTYTQITLPESGRKIKKRVFRNDCFVHDRGWVLSAFLQPVGSKDPNGLIIPNAMDCDGECRTAIKNSLQSLVGDMERVVKELDHLEKVDKKVGASIIDKCNGSLELQNITVKFNKTKTGCEITFPDGCNNAERLLKMEELSNNILFNSSSEPEKKCRDVDFAFRNQCGLNKGLHGNKDKQYKRFSEVRKKLQDVLKEERGRSNISEGIMMCLFNIETTNYDASKVNYTVCDPTYVDQFTNLKNRKKLGVSKPTDYIFKGSRSSAHGLGQVTLEQTCFTIKANPGLYPEIKNADKLNCNAPEGKRAVQEFFIKSGEDETLQMRLARDTLREKWFEAGKHMPTAIKYYNGDDKNGNFVNFVTSCSYCFNKPSKTKTWTDEDIHKCILGVRNKILNTTKEEN